MVYENVVKEGTAVDDNEMHDLLAEMNDDSMVVCQGITDYQQYRSSIGYDIKPSEVVQLASKYSPRHRMCFLA